MSMETMQRDANRFAMELLMPAEMVMTEVEKLGGYFDIENEPRIAVLAKRFKVSEQLMTIRLATLLGW